MIYASLVKGKVGGERFAVRRTWEVQGYIIQGTGTRNILFQSSSPALDKPEPHDPSDGPSTSLPPTSKS
jgi:hypothetical protein